METTTVKIQNLKCGGCANTIITQLSKLKGISEVLVNNETHDVTFNYATELGFEDAKKKLSSLGYPMAGEANAMTKKAKSYVSCAIGKMTK